MLVRAAHSATHGAGRTMPRRFAAAAIGGLAATAVLLCGLPAGAVPVAALTVTRLDIRSGGSWGNDTVTIRGTGFTGPSPIASVRFGRAKADGFQVIDATTIRATSPEVRNRRHVVDVRVVLRSGARSAVSSRDRFTYVVPTMNTRLNGHWTTNQSIAIARPMRAKAKRLQAAAVAHNAGRWTPAMGRSALRRAAGWLGLPYSWAGGSYTGPSRGSRSGDGLIGTFSGRIWGFDCSGLTMYAWAKYEHVAHSAATQRRQAGRFHPSIGELQPGDLLFFSGGGRRISHVVMYAGKGLIIQSSESGWPVRYSTLAQAMASHPRYFGATRPMSTGRQGHAPVISSVSATSSPTTGGSTLTVHGRYLDTTSRVRFGSAATYSFSVRSAGTITVQVPPHAAGPVSISVGNAWGSSPATSHARLTYVAPTPTG